METKVKAAGVASYLVGVAALAILNGVTSTDLVAGLPDIIEVFVAPAITTAAGLLAGWNAAHSPRSDIGQP
jgi:hypothetical protein